MCMGTIVPALMADDAKEYGKSKAEENARAIDPGVLTPVLDASLELKFCTAYVYRKYDANIGRYVYLVSENLFEHDWGSFIESRTGSKNVCVYFPGSICLATECSSARELAQEYGIL